LSNITYRGIESPQPAIQTLEKMKYLLKLLYMSAILSCTMLVMTSGYPRAAAIADETMPAGAIEKFNASLLEAMKRADELGYDGRYKLLDPVIRDVFDLSFMATRALGSHWKKLTPKQQGIYLNTYADWTIATYAGRFDGYSGESFVISDSSGGSQDTRTVKSSINKPDGERIVDFIYLLRRISGKWQVVDIRIVGVSQLALTKAQFVSVMNKEGFESLISMLREKTKAFAGKGKGG
jgi:phospholipid transport system substrate-binding protein